MSTSAATTSAATAAAATAAATTTMEWEDLLRQLKSENNGYRRNFDEVSL